jgi:myosin heavy subunit
MTESKTIERLAVLEQSTKGNTRRIEKLETSTEILSELKVLVELQTDMNKEQNIQMRNFETTLNKVNDNLSAINTSQDQLKSDLGSIGGRVKHIEDGSKIDIVKLAGKILIAAICAWVLLQIGLK